MRMPGATESGKFLTRLVSRPLRPPRRSAMRMRPQPSGSAARASFPTSGGSGSGWWMGPAPGRRSSPPASARLIGSHPLNDFLLDEPTVSRFHCEIRVDATAAASRDLGSRNGTVVDGVA